MSTRRTRREVLKGSLALAGWSVLGLPEFVLPALAQGETVVPFTDWPANFNPSPAPDRRTFDLRKLDGPYTPPDQFFTTQHYGHQSLPLQAATGLYQWGFAAVFGSTFCHLWRSHFSSRLSKRNFLA